MFWRVIVLASVIFIGALGANSVSAATDPNICEKNSQFFLNLKNFSGQVLSGLKYELYEQRKDINGLPIAGTKIGGGTIDVSGQASLSFKPDKTKTYALKVWEKRSDLGEFWFFDSIRFVCNYDRTTTKYLPAFRIVLRDGQGKLKRNYNFSLYAQQYDADGNPFFESSDLITNLKTNGGGQATIYVASYNPYRIGQTGTYILSAKDAGGNNSVVYNVQIPNDQDYTFSYTFSSLSGEIRDGRKKLLVNREIRLYEQLSGEGGKELGKQLLKTKTTTSGRFQFEYPAGTYALVVLDDFNHENIFWNTTIKARVNNSKKLVVNAVKFSLADTQGEGLSKDASLKLYTLTTDDGTNYYRDKEVGTVKLSASKTAYYSLIPGTYLAVYVGKGGREYGRYFRAANGQLNTAPVTVNVKYKVDPDKIFRF